MALLSKEREGERTEGRAADAHSDDLSIISKEMRIEGDVETKGRARVDGSISGNVRARSIELSPSGSVEGDVEAVTMEGSAGAFVIDGTVSGAVRAPQVEVGEGGSVLGGVEAAHATVRGKVQGGIRARDRLALKATANVEGDIDARRLALEEGGQVNGNIRIGDRASLGESAKPREPAGEEKPGRPSSAGEGAARGTRASA